MNIFVGSDAWPDLKADVDAARARLVTAAYRPNRDMCRLLVLGEDHRITRHPGVDPLALCRAIWRTYVRNRQEGGSTIAMQIVRVLTGRYERNWRRKAREMVLAIRLTQHVPSDELPPLYLSIAYYGWRMNGFGQACRRLRIDPNACSRRDSAMLVARIKYPEPRICSPGRSRQIKNRAEYLLERMKSHE